MNSGKPLTNLIYEQIYRDVIDGTFEVNEIITEGQLIQRYGVSKSPVREALISLCDEQVLQSIPRPGYRVVQIMPDEMREIAETRQAMELFMFEKSFPALDKEAVAKLRECNERIREADEPSLPANKRWEGNVEFHLLLASFAGNAYMYKLLRDTLRIDARATTQYFKNIYAPELQQKRFAHEHFIDACENGDYQAARNILLEDTNQLLWWAERRA